MAAYTVVPTTPPTLLPLSPSDGQVFLDYDGVQWMYNAEMDLWLRYGAVEALPLATATSPGLLSGAQKALLDNIPTTPGGFGIITPNNPLGPITGNIQLASDSLDIECVSSTNQPINPNCASGVQCEGLLNSSPGITFALSENFLKSLVVKLPGQAGPVGPQGPTGPQGVPGWSQGPKGIQGPAGSDTNVTCTLGNLSFEDLPGVTDSAVVDIRMSPTGCNLIYTLAPIQIPSGPAQALSAAPLTRSVSYANTVQRGNCDTLSRVGDWTLSQPPGDNTPLDMQLVRLAKNATPDVAAGTAFNTYSLTKFIADVTAQYQATLDGLNTTWSQQVQTYIQGIDGQARTILSDLANQLAQCEFNSPAQICMSITPFASSPSTPVVPTTPTPVVPTTPTPVVPTTPTPVAPTPPPVTIPQPVPTSQPAPVPPTVPPCNQIMSSLTGVNGTVALTDPFGITRLGELVYPAGTNPSLCCTRVLRGCSIRSVPQAWAPSKTNPYGTLQAGQSVPIAYDFYCDGNIGEYGQAVPASGAFGTGGNTPNYRLRLFYPAGYNLYPLVGTMNGDVVYNCTTCTGSGGVPVPAGWPWPVTCPNGAIQAYNGWYFQNTAGAQYDAVCAYTDGVVTSPSTYQLTFTFTSLPTVVQQMFGITGNLTVTIQMKTPTA